MNRIATGDTILNFLLHVTVVIHIRTISGVVILPSEFCFLAADGTRAGRNELWGAAAELYRVTVRAFRLIELQKVVVRSEGLFRLTKRGFLLVPHKCTVSLATSGLSVIFFKATDI